MVTGSFSLVGIEDGVGNETIFTITSTPSKPSRPTSVNTDGHVPSGWYAAPQDVSATYQYQWVSKREKKEGNWSLWSEPSLYSNFADGIKYVLNYYGLSSSATIKPTSWSLTPPTMTSTMRYLWNYEIVGLNSGEQFETDKTVIGIYGDDGEPGTPGEDGVGIDYIREYYLATSMSSGVTTSTSGWTMSVQTITPSKKYLWNYEVVRYTNGLRDVGDPKIIGVYGDKGDQGDPGQDGTDGTDGKSYEYCYKATQYNSAPSTPTSSNVDGSIPSGWYSTQPSISAINAYVWVSQRVKTNGVWSAWSTPTLKNRWAYDGRDGANGDKGAKMRMRTWASGVRYLQGTEGEEFYDIVVYETKLYLCTKTHTSSSSNNPVKSIESYLGYWESAQQWTFIATQLLLAGKIVSDKITADLIDATGITAKNVNLTGKITATSGNIGGFTVTSNSLICEDGNARLQIEISGERFFRLNSPSESAFMRLRADDSICVDITSFGMADSAVGLRLMCNSTGYGKAIDSTGNVRLIARKGEWIIVNGLSLNSRTVEGSANIYTNDDIIIANSSNDITLYLSNASSPGKMIYIKRKGTGKVTVKGNIITQDANTIITSLDITDYPPRLFIYHGGVWYEFSGRH